MFDSFRAAYKIVKEQERKKRLYKDLIGESPRVELIKDLVNQALHNVVIEMVFPNSTRVVIRREEAFNQLEKIRREERTW